MGMLRVLLGKHRVDSPSTLARPPNPPMWLAMAKKVRPSRCRPWRYTSLEGVPPLAA